MKVLASVWFPGLGAALSSIGFGAITAFSALLFVARRRGLRSPCSLRFLSSAVSSSVISATVSPRQGSL